MKQYSLTSPQENIDKLQTFYSGTSISNICGAVLFAETPDKTVLEQAVNEAIRLHDSLRLRFCKRDGKTVQYISDYSYERLEFIPFENRESLTKFGEAYAKKPFEAPDSPMYRAAVFTLPKGSGVLLCASHLISDAWTYTILAKDICDICRELSKNKPARLPQYSYTDYIKNEQAYLRSERYMQDKAWWAAKYNDKPEHSPVKLVARPVSLPAAGRYTTKISPKLSAAIDAFCANTRTSPAIFFEAAVISYLAAINAENKSLTIGIPLHNRCGGREKQTAGMFAATVPLTVELSDHTTALSLLGEIADCHRQIFRHRKYPYTHILRDVRDNTGFQKNLYEVTVSYQNTKTNVSGATMWFSNGFCETPLAFHIDNRDGGDAYTVNIDYQTAVFPQEKEIILLARRILLVIHQLLSESHMPLKSLSILPDAEYQQVVYGFNDTALNYPGNACVHSLFSAQARLAPDKIALIYETRQFTYQRLDEMSNAVAHVLRTQGIRPNDVVPVIAERSPDMLAAILGVLKAGGAYMPVSPDYPAERIAYMLGEVNAKLVLTFGGSRCNANLQVKESRHGLSGQRAGSFVCMPGHVQEISLDSFDYDSHTKPVENVNCADDLCYVIFTSGSTGKPKGACVSHKNVVNYCAKNSLNVCGGILDNPSQSIVSVTNFIFDIFVTESILPLLNGIPICLASEAQLASQADLGSFILKNGAQILQTTPTKMRSYIFDKKNLGYLSALKIIILGGEELPADLYAELKKYTAAKIYNIYGPAETTVWSSFARIEDSDITIGRPIANTQLYILDREEHPLPIGILGEICISGDGVCKGYIGRPDLTAKRFVTNPFIKGKTMYHTGDLGRFRADGSIEFWGRTDAQIKMNGMRIEPGEIENVMGSFAGIGMTAVTAGRDERGRQYLAGYYTAEGEIDEKELRAYMAARLPLYMVPNYFMRLLNMPITPSGKTDRKRLPAPHMNYDFRHYAAPKTETERLLCNIVSELLGGISVGIDDDFFELGGDSLKAMEYTVNAEGKGISIPLASVFAHRTVRELCAFLKDENSDAPKTYSLEGYPAPRSNKDILLYDVFTHLTKCLYHFEISGLEHLDAGCQYIFCPNHASDLDCMWVWAALRSFMDFNNTSALIAIEHLDKALSRCFFRLAGGIPIDRRGDFAPSLARAAQVLSDKKHCMLIHPEGTRTRTGALGSFKQGAAMLAIKTGVNAVPVFISGSGAIFPPDSRLPKLLRLKTLSRYPLAVRFGMPISPLGKNAPQLTEEIRQQVAAMASLHN